jgi:hypothetical protein
MKVIRHQAICINIAVTPEMKKYPVQEVFIILGLFKDGFFVISAVEDMVYKTGF